MSLNMTEAEVTAAAEKIGDVLRGTCMSLHSALCQHELPTELEDDSQFCQILDAQVFCCTQCDWWGEMSEMSEDEDGVCDECAAENRGDDEDED